MWDTRVWQAPAGVAAENLSRFDICMIGAVAPTQLAVGCVRGCRWRVRRERIAEADKEPHSLRHGRQTSLTASLRKRWHLPRRDPAAVGRRGRRLRAQTGGAVVGRSATAADVWPQRSCASLALGSLGRGSPATRRDLLASDPRSNLGASGTKCSGSPWATNARIGRSPK